MPWAVAYGLFFLARTSEPEKFLYRVTSRSPVRPEDFGEDFIEHDFKLEFFVFSHSLRPLSFLGAGFAKSAVIVISKPQLSECDNLMPFRRPFSNTAQQNN